MCTLRHPFVANNLLGLIMKILREVPEPITGEYNRDLLEAVKMMLIKDMTQRYSVVSVLNLPIFDSYIRHYYEVTSTNTESNSPVRELDRPETPSERMRRKKREEADKRAQLMAEAARESMRNTSIQKLQRKSLFEQSDVHEVSQSPLVEFNVDSSISYKEMTTDSNERRMEMTDYNPLDLINTQTKKQGFLESIGMRSFIPEDTEIFTYSLDTVVLFDPDNYTQKVNRSQVLEIKEEDEYEYEYEDDFESDSEVDSYTSDQPYEDFEETVLKDINLARKSSYKEKAIDILGNENFSKIYIYLKQHRKLNTPDDIVTFM